jgi:hypothetical protein
VKAGIGYLALVRNKVTMVRSGLFVFSTFVDVTCFLVINKDSLVRLGSLSIVKKGYANLVYKCSDKKVPQTKFKQEWR